MKLPRFPRLVSLLLPLICVLLLTACQQHKPLPFKLTDIAGHMPDLQFQLTDDDGKTVTANDFRGKVVLLYFGYTHCPDVCPTTLYDMAGWFKTLGPQADGLKAYFFTVDP